MIERLERRGMTTTPRELSSPQASPSAAKAALDQRRRRWRPEPSAWIGLILALPYILMLAVMVVYPFIRLTLTALGPPSGGSNFTHFLNNRANLAVMRITFVDAAYVTALTVGIGALTAWWLRTTQSRVMRLLILSAILLLFGALIAVTLGYLLVGRDRLRRALA